MNREKLVIFDLDGTLLDTSEGILSSAKYAIESAGRSVPDSNVLSTYIGPPIQQSFAKTFSISGQELDEMTKSFRNRYKDVDLYKATPYGGIFDLCMLLKENGFILAVATYKREDYAKKLLSHFRFDEYFDIICGSDFEGKLSKADIIKQAILLSGVKDFSSVFMIGDTIHDAVGADNLKLNFIGVTYGFGFKERKDIICKYFIGSAKTPYEIASILLGV